MSKKNPDEAKKPEPDKPIYLARSSPLVAGGKARLLSARKVTPKEAELRELDEANPETHGYTEQAFKGLRDAGEALSSWDWHLHVRKRADLDEQERQEQIERDRDREKRLLSQEERLAAAQAEAVANRRDVSHEVWVLRRMLERGRAVQAERRLQRIELYAYRGKRAA